MTPGVYFGETKVWLSLLLFVSYVRLIQIIMQKCSYFHVLKDEVLSQSCSINSFKKKKF